MAVGFVVRHFDDGFAKFVRNEAELHPWAASHQGWKRRAISLGSQCAALHRGIGECSIEVEELDAEVAAAGVRGVGRASANCSEASPLRAGTSGSASGNSRAASSNVVNA